MLMFARWGEATSPSKATLYSPQDKPHTKLVEVKALQRTQKSWSHLAVDDAHITASYVQTQPGEKVSRRFGSR